MTRTGPIVIIDDDEDDLELYKEVFTSLKIENEIVTFSCPEDALEYLRARVDPCFFILCDINMPKMNGIELRDKINKDQFLRFKTVPFLFLSTSNHMDHIYRAYNLSIQGYFKKPEGFQNIQSLFKYIISYWSNSLHPKLPA